MTCHLLVIWTSLLFLPFLSCCRGWTLSTPRYLHVSNGEIIAYDATEGTCKIPGIVFCNGFRSEMTGRKALALEQHCKNVNRACVRYDYRGHGKSSGDFMSFTLSDWIQDALEVLDCLTHQPQILVGSSMGAWIALHVALARPDRVAGIVGIASAPDFTQDLWNKLSLDQQQELEIQGIINWSSAYSDKPYPITKQLIDDGTRWLLFDKTSIPISCPVHLLHGQEDEDVPWERSMTLVNRLESPNVSLTLIKNGNHRLSEPSDLVHIISAVETITKANKG